MTVALMLATPATVPVQAQEPPLVVPTQWTAMPPLPWRVAPTVSPDLIGFVAGEVRAGRCGATGGTIEVELAVYVRADGLIRAVVPRAIACPGVEQFAAGLVSSFARNNVRLPAAGWYQTAITFDWSR